VGADAGTEVEAGFGDPDSGPLGARDTVSVCSSDI
jgi:hypothetical protein